MDYNSFTIVAPIRSFQWGRSKSQSQSKNKNVTVRWVEIESLFRVGVVLIWSLVLVSHNQHIDDLRS